MKRYKQDYRGDFYEADDGPWVRYEDAEAAICKAVVRALLKEREK